MSEIDDLSRRVAEAQGWMLATETIRGSCEPYWYVFVDLEGGRREKKISYEKDYRPPTNIAQAMAFLVWFWQKFDGIIQLSNGDGDSLDLNFIPRNSFEMGGVDLKYDTPPSEITIDQIATAVCEAVLAALEK